MTTSKDRITFGDDYSAGSDLAWQWLTAQRWPGWSVDVVNVTDPGPRILSLSTYEPLREISPAQPRSAPDECGFVGIRHLTTAYDPRQVLSDQTDSRLLVVGARGRGLLKSMHLGSTADWLIRCPGMPLVIVRAGRPVRQVLACVDGSDPAQAAVGVLAAMPWISGTHVVVLSVRERHPDIGDKARSAADVLEAAGAHTQVVVIGHDLPYEGRCAVCGRTFEGEHAVARDHEGLFENPQYRILDAIDRRRPDLVVLGTKGRTGLPRMLVGSVAGAVARYAGCSVLLTRGPHAD